MFVGGAEASQDVFCATTLEISKDPKSGRYLRENMVNGFEGLKQRFRTYRATKGAVKYNTYGR